MTERESPEIPLRGKHEEAEEDEEDDNEEEDDSEEEDDNEEDEGATCPGSVRAAWST